MTNISLYKDNTNTVLLNKLSNVITRLRKSNTDLRHDFMAKSLIKELKQRELTKNQTIKYRRLFDRYTWI